MKFNEVFGYKPIIGMIHLAGGDRLTACSLKTRLKIERAIEELAVFEEEGLDGAIIENYHADYLETLKEFPPLQMPTQMFHCLESEVLPLHQG